MNTTLPDTTMTNDPARPIAFVLAATNHGSMIVNRFDYRQVNDNAYGVGHQLLNFSSFDPEEVSFVLQLLETRRAHYGDGVFAIDCGANIGVHTLEWAKFMHGWGQVLAFEAQERVFYALVGNLALNNCFNARALWAAVGAESGQMGVPIPDYFVPSSFGSLELRPSQKNEFIGQTVDYSPQSLMPTQMIALDDLHIPRVDLIKIDIEGMEIDALKGARQTIEKSRPIMLIEQIKTNAQAISELLTPLGYKIHPLGINLLAVHQDDPLTTQIEQI